VCFVITLESRFKCISFEIKRKKREHSRDITPVKKDRDQDKK
jgi:hypothetical protein